MAAIHASTSNEQRPGSSSGAFHFPKSGLGTPDFFYFAGGAGSGSTETPSWLKHSKDQSPLKQEGHDSDSAPLSGAAIAKRSDVAEDGNRLVRALSDPTVRNTPAWLQPKSNLDQEPNPFEHSFSGKNPYETAHAPPRRARSQSVKSSHGANPALRSEAAPVLKSNSVKNVEYAALSTPSQDIGNFGGQTAAAGNVFDPSSVRTGFTPGGPALRNSILGPGHPASANDSYLPHSPATQALFAMMTNATPGLPSLPKVESDYSSSDNAGSGQHEQQRSHHASRRDPRSGTDSGSGRSPSSGQSNHIHSQPIPRPIATASIYGQRNGGPSQAPAPPAPYSGYQSTQNLLSQSMPRPLGPQTHVNNVPVNAPPPIANGANNQFAAPGSGHNPLFLLSQAHAALNPAELPEDDTVLAAAALSGLSTPRPAYVGGPAPTAIMPPGYTSSQLNLQQPPLSTSTTARLASTRKNSTAGPTTTQKGKKAGAGGSNKRKKADSPAPPFASSSIHSTKKPKRNARRRAAAANAQPIVDPDTNSEAENDFNIMVDDDAVSMTGSLGRSDNGGISFSNLEMEQHMQLYPYDEEDGENVADGTRKGGRGPKQQFETEDDKRKNFLERNRQAALKCRQRKKQWLTDLQQRVENLTQDNQVLQQTCSHLRDEVMTLRNILLSHKDCPVGNAGGAAGGQQGGSNVTVGGLLAAQAHHGGQHTQQQQLHHQPAPRPY